MASMLNMIWAGMLLTGIVYALFTGNMEAVSNACLEYAESAVTLCISMAGAMALWVGLDGDRRAGGTDRGVHEETTAVHQLPVSGRAERSSGERLHRDKYCGEYAGAGLGVHAGGALSYNSDRLKNPLQNQGFPPNLVLMERCSIASKHF